MTKTYVWQSHWGLWRTNCLTLLLLLPSTWYLFWRQTSLLFCCVHYYLFADRQVYHYFVMFIIIYLPTMYRTCSSPTWINYPPRVVSLLSLWTLPNIVVFCSGSIIIKFAIRQRATWHELQLWSLINIPRKTFPERKQGENEKTRKDTYLLYRQTPFCACFQLIFSSTRLGRGTVQIGLLPLIFGWRIYY